MINPKVVSKQYLRLLDLLRAWPFSIYESGKVVII